MLEQIFIYELLQLINDKTRIEGKFLNTKDESMVSINEVVKIGVINLNNLKSN